MKGIRKVMGVASALMLTLAGVVASAGPAQATHIKCGALITQNTTLHNDIGPCRGDGLIVRASNITLNLNGKRVFAANGEGDNAGIRLAMVTGVTVERGIVEGFDAGIVLGGGNNNVVRGMTVRNNINDGLSSPCDLGDGIALFGSDNNFIDGNFVINNGPYGGISLVGDADRNMIRGNRVLDNDVEGRSGSGCGNTQQDEGIRIEGPGANNNSVLGNTVRRSLLSGIGLHGHVGCDRNNPEEPPNTDNAIVGNTVSTTRGTPIAAGINVLQQGPFGTIVCAAYRNTFNGNTSTNNEADGIFIPGTSTDNVVNGNTVNDNGIDGIYLGGPVFENRFTNVGPSLLDLVSPNRPPYVECTAAPCPAGTDYFVLEGSGSGDVTGRLVAIEPITIPPAGFDTSTSGCEPDDFVASGFRPGDIALIQRGFCARDLKVQNAVDAGASAVIMFNEGSEGRTGVLTAGVGPKNIPVVGTSFAVGQQLYNLTKAGPVTIRVVTNTRNERVRVAPGAWNTEVRYNRGQGNDEHDGHDDSGNCDNNDWFGNQFGTVNRPCVAEGGSGVVTPAAAAASESADSQSGRESVSNISRRGGLAAKGAS